jgi:DNA-directed RNA polymerase subunit RPC12/RpoP
VGTKGAMRVRCSNCGAEYEAAVTPAGLGLVGRCERCGRTALHPADEDQAAAPAGGDGADRHGASGRDG